MIEVEQAGLSDQEVQLEPEAKASMLVDILEIVLGDVISQGKDIPLAALKSVRFDFADDGSVKVAIASADSPDAQPSEDISEVSGDKVMAALEEAVADLGIEAAGSLDA